MALWLDRALPEGKQELTGYIYEPWHYRYVGRTGGELHEQDLCLEEYTRSARGEKD